MEAIIVILGIGLIVGLIIRKKGDNTMDTLSKGCGCLFVILLILTILLALPTE
tara:strand:+ start:505 stop:663 length:159 start_codon:yes stop_codon:yes gene_type:complete